MNININGINMNNNKWNMQNDSIASIPSPNNIGFEIERTEIIIKILNINIYHKIKLMKNYEIDHRTDCNPIQRVLGISDGIGSIEQLQAESIR